MSPEYDRGRQSENGVTMQFTISLKSLRRGLVWALVLLIFAGLCAEIANALLELGETSEVVAFFSLSYEKNLPACSSRR
jgi:hypothetical protein